MTVIWNAMRREVNIKMVALLEALIKEGLITEEQLEEAREKQVGAKRPIQELLVEMGFIKEEGLKKRGYSNR